MALKYCDMYYNDQSYYVNKCTSADSLEQLHESIKQARQELIELETAACARYNEITAIVWYHQVDISREQNQYSRDKKVKINVRLYKVGMLNGEQCACEWVYGKHNQYAYQEKKAAYAYAKELSNQYNHCKIIDKLKK